MFNQKIFTNNIEYRIGFIIYSNALGYNLKFDSTKFMTYQYFIK